MAGEIVGRVTAGEPIHAVPFQEHIELLRRYLAHREEIAERIEAVLNAQRKPVRYRSLLSNDFEACFAQHPVVRNQLEEAYWASGFRPRQVQHVYNDLIDPVEMMVRGTYCWQQTKWPGRSDRIHYAHTLFNLYVLRWLQFLSMRVFDVDPGGAGGRMADIQSVLDEVWKGSPAGQPAFIRDARWLIPLAQSLITDELAPYFEVARQVTDTLPAGDALEIQKAHVRMLGGHLTSQIRHYSTRDSVSIDDQSIVIRTRSSNALDLALLVQGLVALLKTYDSALEGGDERTRLDMAGAIFQGISPDPELFLNRIDMLSTYTMIEDVFIASVAYSPHGHRHLQLLKEYSQLTGRLIPHLRDDFSRFRPVADNYSPYGVVFGLPSNLIEHMALKAVQRDAESRFSLEDVFGDDPDTAKLAWVNGWRELPHIPREVQQRYNYPQPFAEEIYSRIERELQRSAGATTGRLYIGSSDAPEVPARHLVSSDREIVAAGRAERYDRAQLLRDRREGHFLVSYETPGGWTGLKKSLLAEVLGVGQDATVTGLPPDAAEVLRLMCVSLRKES